MLRYFGDIISISDRILVQLRLGKRLGSASASAIIVSKSEYLQDGVTKGDMFCLIDGNLIILLQYTCSHSGLGPVVAGNSRLLFAAPLWPNAAKVAVNGIRYLH